jgi:hypothetical protein
LEAAVTHVPPRTGDDYRATVGSLFVVSAALHLAISPATSFI